MPSFDLYCPLDPICFATLNFYSSLQLAIYGLLLLPASITVVTMTAVNFTNCSIKPHLLPPLE
ncbi:unnamed protein product [Ceratitis capitata]|uniref:(Mediterranean fruit fly) hypothetical protein n=1 Tax=Ceratitis capitata TaxID=7213 RepID=A0A811UAX4_CERCA|nr:unnamed protein product [Ceratitis capitata]